MSPLVLSPPIYFDRAGPSRSEQSTLDLGSFTTLKFERQGRVLKVYFNNPSTLNAIDQAAHSEVVRFFAEVATDTETDVVILSGMGRAFSAGGDFDHIQRMIDQPVLFTDSMYEAK